jgi:hypothetical protein
LFDQEDLFLKMVLMPRKNIITLSITLLTALFATFVLVDNTRAEVVIEKRGVKKFGVIKGVVRDKSGKPISQATVAIFRVGTSNLLKQVRATKSGRFFARIIPGTYTILAVAQGFNPVTLKKVEVGGAASLTYGFNLERAGSGNTLPEKQVDRKSAKWAIRASRRSIYQATEGTDKPIIDENSIAVKDNIKEEKPEFNRKGQTAVETFVAGDKKGSYAGVNFATLRPVGENAEVVFAGQTGTSKSAPKRFETTFSFRPNEKHRVSLKGAIAKLGEIKIDEQDETLGQVSFQALDQWRVREGVVVVVGVDYSRFIGAGDDSSFSPRIGFQYDLDSKTRVRSAYTTQTEERTWQKVIELEGNQVLFREPVAIEDIAIEENKPLMNKSSRLEFGIERVLDNSSTIEANVFFDTVTGRGVGLINLPFDTLSTNGFDGLVANQQGKTQGMRAVYNRRLNRTFSAAIGYAFGHGQKLSDKAITNPAKAFENDLFQTFFAQFDADLKTGTSVKTIFRFSPQATVFAIDPFQGRLAIYDPSLSVKITQDLPNWGLPIDAEAVLDARNLFDFQNGVNSEEGLLNLASQRRILRGGILVRF